MRAEPSASAVAVPIAAGAGDRAAARPRSAARRRCCRAGTESCRTCARPPAVANSTHRSPSARGRRAGRRCCRLGQWSRLARGCTLRAAVGRGLDVALVDQVARRCRRAGAHDVGRSGHAGLRAAARRDRRRRSCGRCGGQQHPAVVVLHDEPGVVDHVELAGRLVEQQRAAVERDEREVWWPAGADLLVGADAGAGWACRWPGRSPTGAIWSARNSEPWNEVEGAGLVGADEVGGDGDRRRRRGPGRRRSARACRRDGWSVATAAGRPGTRGVPRRCGAASPAHASCTRSCRAADRVGTLPSASGTPARPSTAVTARVRTPLRAYTRNGPEFTSVIQRFGVVPAGPAGAARRRDYSVPTRDARPAARCSRRDERARSAAVTTTAEPPPAERAGSGRPAADRRAPVPGARSGQGLDVQPGAAHHRPEDDRPDVPRHVAVLLRPRRRDGAADAHRAGPARAAVPVAGAVQPAVHDARHDHVAVLRDARSCSRSPTWCCRCRSARPTSPSRG